MGINFDLPEEQPTETVWVTCTDKNRTLSADIVSQKQNEIVMVTKEGNIRLRFTKANTFGKDLIPSSSTLFHILFVSGM